MQQNGLDKFVNGLLKSLKYGFGVIILLLCLAFLTFPIALSFFNIMDWPFAIFMSNITVFGGLSVASFFIGVIFLHQKIYYAGSYVHQGETVHQFGFYKTAGVVKRRYYTALVGLILNAFILIGSIVGLILHMNPTVLIFSLIVSSIVVFVAYVFCNKWKINCKLKCGWFVNSIIRKKIKPKWV